MHSYFIKSEKIYLRSSLSLSTYRYFQMGSAKYVKLNTQYMYLYIMQSAVVTPITRLSTALSAQRRRVSGASARRMCPNRAWSGTPGSAVVLGDSFAISMAASTKTRCVSKRQVAKWKRLVGRARE